MRNLYIAANLHKLVCYSSDSDEKVAQRTTAVIHIITVSFGRSLCYHRGAEGAPTRSKVMARKQPNFAQRYS